ncbi:MAG: branched-chain amino acid ABC transporter permease [Candidatus Atribacteria bacterium]|nr:MAG: branched-chain amino acid ABC transporter permease [Candidatus Atribacteria bacterium]
MGQILSGYFIYMFSLLLIFIALATILHLQFGLTGIANFGLSGFWGFGMYAFALLVLKLHIPFVIAVILATVLTGIISLALGRIILNLDDQSVLVATLAFLVIIETLIITEKWLTNGVLGIGPIAFPFDFGTYTKFIYFLIILFFTIALIFYTSKVHSSPYGRLLLSIQDNEPLAQSLGKPTFRRKLILFTFASALAGFFGALAAPVYNFMFPKYMEPGITFTLWIALILGARKKVFGGFVGILVTIGLFDIVLETVVPIPSKYAGILYNTKYLLYGLILVLILMFRPSGILGDQKKTKNISIADKTEG